MIRQKTTQDNNLPSYRFFIKTKKKKNSIYSHLYLNVCVCARETIRISCERERFCVHKRLTVTKILFIVIGCLIDKHIM